MDALELIKTQHYQVIDTATIVIAYDERGEQCDYIEIERTDAPIRPKICSSRNNNVYLELYKSNNMNIPVFSKLARKILASYGFTHVRVTSASSWRSQPRSTRNVIESLFTETTYKNGVLTLSKNSIDKYRSRAKRGGEYGRAE